MENQIVTYKKPTIISEADANKYYNKIKIFKHFKAAMTVIYFYNPNISIEYDLGKYKNMNGEEYEEYIKTEQYEKEHDFECFYVGKIKKDTLSKNYCYMYNFEKEDETDLDEIDKRFVEHRTADKKIELYGLHTYGGYRGFFCPDFYEVIGLLSEEITADDLNSVERLYVTTEPHPSDNIYECFDYKKDMHRGKTICYVFYSDDQKTRSPKRSKISE